MGGGFASSNIRSQSQMVAAADFQFHIKRHYFQAGVLMSGDQFLSNNNIQGHACYGLRKEGNRYNLAAFAGPSYHTGIKADAAGLPEFYDGPGFYISAQAVSKLTYDIGLGLEIFDDISQNQNIFGFKIIAFFSGAYRGPKMNFNPNVRSEQ